MTTNYNHWQAPKNTQLPDFIICGAMKSGTSTLHAMLNQHPDVFIPEKEVHFFDCDNPLQHPDFNYFNNNKWQKTSVDCESDRYWQWYNQQFSAAQPGAIIGEDSTTYLASPLAAKRIAMQDKAIKIIIMLRQPSKRAYSQYWHLVRSGRAPYSFEQTLQLNPNSVLNRSMYLTQIKQWLEYIPKEQIKFVFFEDFLTNKQRVLKEVCQFINIPYEKLPVGVDKVHENITTYPKYYHLQLLKNKLFPMAGNLTYTNHFSFESYTKPTGSLLRYINALHRKINPLVTKKPLPINKETQKFLDSFFINELEGLNELVDFKAYSLWFNQYER